MARQFASLDHLSGGRAAWNVVTSWDAFTGENFRRGGFLAQGDRYERARTFLATAWELFDSWHGDEIMADKDTGQFLADPGPGTFEHQDGHFDIAGQFNVPRSPQGRPVIFQAGDSDEGREFAAASAPTRSSPGTARWRPARPSTPTSRAACPSYGRRRDELLILPAATFVLGDTDAEAAEIARQVRRQQVSGADRDQVPRAAVEPGPVRLRPGRPAARRRPGGRARTRSPGAGPACGCTGTRWRSRRSGGPGPRPGTCRSAS